MVDVFSNAKRSEVMSRIRSSGNKDTEQALIAVFRGSGFSGWRRRQKLFGKPDFVFRKKRVAVFVDGCFWHACPLHGTMPKTNTEFWMAKISKNRLRDQLVNETLEQKGWVVLRIWEHELRKKNAAPLQQKLDTVLGKVFASRVS
jgi:DNA mismatch endonuclease (patch repair protein)